MNTILTFALTKLPQVDQVGSKALSLITMTKDGMPVPPGFVLTVKFFEPWMTALQATPEWKAVQETAGDELGQATKALQSLCRDLKFDDQQQEELDRMLQSFQASCGATLCAVRSSSPEEDLEGASLAGGYETTLGVPAAEVEGATLHSFASSFDERVFVYKREHGFPTDQPRIAVIV